MRTSVGQAAAATRTLRNWLGPSNGALLHQLGFSRDSNTFRLWAVKRNQNAAAQKMFLARSELSNRVAQSVAATPMKRHAAAVPRNLSLTLLSVSV